MLDSHTHLDITVGEAGVPGGGPADDPVARGVARPPRSASTGWSRSAWTSPSSRWGADARRPVPRRAGHRGAAPQRGAPAGRPRRGAAGDRGAGRAGDRVRAIGETGLDYFRTGDDGRAAQEASFRAHIAIAKRYGKALVIHDRDAHDDVLRILDDEGAPDTVVLHCFSGDADVRPRVRAPRLPAQLRRHRHLRQRRPRCARPPRSPRWTSCWSRPTRRT